MTTRTTNRKTAKATAAQAPADVELNMSKASFEEAMESMNPMAAIKDLGKRAIIALVANLATMALGFTSALYISSWLSLLVLSATGWMFIAVAIQFFVLMLGVAASLLAGAWVQRWVVSGEAFNDLVRAKSWVKRKVDGCSTTLKKMMSAERKEAM